MKLGAKGEKDIKSVNLRLDVSKEDDRIIYEFLQDKKNRGASSVSVVRDIVLQHIKDSKMPKRQIGLQEDGALSEIAVALNSINKTLSNLSVVSVGDSSGMKLDSDTDEADNSLNASTLDLLSSFDM